MDRTTLKKWGKLPKETTRFCFAFVLLFAARVLIINQQQINENQRPCIRLDFVRANIKKKVLVVVDYNLNLAEELLTAMEGAQMCFAEPERL
ncbi:hypothetical protein CFP56_010479 [Quercus suber]|uniref:Uncharacterized protein n=1 Tax=Quercus suber TaxID=58331 RepID=A0AAW0M534_QUESU